MTGRADIRGDGPTVAQSAVVALMLPANVPDQVLAVPQARVNCPPARTPSRQGRECAVAVAVPARVAVDGDREPDNYSRAMPIDRASYSGRSTTLHCR